MILSILSLASFSTPNPQPSLNQGGGGEDDSRSGGGAWVLGIAGGARSSGALLVWTQYLSVLAISTNWSNSSGLTRKELAPSSYARLMSRICPEEASTITRRRQKAGCSRIHF